MSFIRQHKGAVMWSLALHVAVVAAVLVGIPLPERPRVPVATRADPGHHRRSRPRSSASRKPREEAARQERQRQQREERQRREAAEAAARRQQQREEQRVAAEQRAREAAEQKERERVAAAKAEQQRREREAQEKREKDAQAQRERGGAPRSARAEQRAPQQQARVGAAATARARGRGERGARGWTAGSVHAHDREPDQAQVEPPVERAARHRMRRDRRADADGRRRERRKVESCNGDDAVRRSIERAVLDASPLPKPPTPALFERNVKVSSSPRSERFFCLQNVLVWES